MGLPFGAHDREEQDTTATSQAVEWYICPAKFFPVPAQYENNFAQKF
jgi:hypothetical protein